MNIRNRKLTNPTTVLDTKPLQSVEIQILKNELDVSTSEIIQNIVDNLIIEFDATGKISEETASNLIGKRPKAPKASSDTQFLDAWAIAEREYENKLRFIQQYISQRVADTKK